MGNISPAPLACWSSVLTITLPRLSDGTIIIILSSLQLLASEVSADYYTHPPGIVILLILTLAYIQAMVLHLHTQSRLNNHTVCKLYRIMVMATSVIGLMQMGNIAPTIGIKHTFHSFQVHHANLFTI